MAKALRDDHEATLVIRGAAQAARQVEGLEEEPPPPAPIIHEEPEVELEEELIVGDPDEAEKPVEPEMEDRLSAFEVEDIKSELMRRGVPSHEIDTILHQVKDLPRELVDELIKSVGKEEE